MRRPALYLAAALLAALLAVSTATSTLSLIGLRRAERELSGLARRQRSLIEHIERLSASGELPSPLLAPEPAGKQRDGPARRGPALSDPAPPGPESVGSVSAGSVSAGSVPAGPARGDIGMEPPPPSLCSVAPCATRPPAFPPPAVPAAVPAATPSVPPEADLGLLQALAEARRFYREARYAEACRPFAAVLSLRPEDARTRQAYADCLYRANPGATENYPEIERQLLQVLEDLPDNAPALVLLGRLNVERQRWTEARQCFERALQLSPGDPESLRLAGFSAWYGGEADSAEGFFQQACSANPQDAESWYYLALARERLGKAEAAVEGYRRCLELEPAYPGARLRAGLALLGLARPAEAQGLLREQVKARPSVQGWAALGDCAHALGQTEEAEKLWRQALAATDPDPATPQQKRAAAELCLRLSRSAWQRQAGRQTLALAEQGLRYEPLPLLRVYQGLGLLAVGQAERGRALLQAMLGEAPGGEAAALALEALAGGMP